MCLRCEDVARQRCAMVHRWQFFASFLRPVFPASLVQHISDMHPRCAPRPHHVWKYTAFVIIHRQRTIIVTVLRSNSEDKTKYQSKAETGVLLNASISSYMLVSKEQFVILNGSNADSLYTQAPTACVIILWIVFNIGDDPCSGTPVEYTANSGTIQSPGYATSTYQDNSDCQWRITASHGYVRILRRYNSNTFLNQCRKSLTLYTSLSLLGGFRAIIYGNVYRSASSNT